MADKGAPDPLAPWRELLSQWEKSANTLANRGMATDGFSGSMNQAMNVLLQGQQHLGEAMVKYLAALNLPSRADLLTLGEQLGAIEAQLASIARILERQNAAAAPAPPPAPAVELPPRTKRPPRTPA
jgi:hypothetical protein